MTVKYSTAELYPNLLSLLHVKNQTKPTHNNKNKNNNFQPDMVPHAFSLRTQERQTDFSILQLHRETLSKPNQISLLSWKAQSNVYVSNSGSSIGRINFQIAGA